MWRGWRGVGPAKGQKGYARVQPKPTGTSWGSSVSSEGPAPRLKVCSDRAGSGLTKVPGHRGEIWQRVRSPLASRAQGRPGDVGHDAILGHAVVRATKGQLKPLPALPTASPLNAAECWSKTFPSNTSRARRNESSVALSKVWWTFGTISAQRRRVIVKAQVICDS